MQIINASQFIAIHNLKTNINENLKSRNQLNKRSILHYLMLMLQLKSSRTFMYLEDIPDHPDLPDSYHDVWHIYHLTTFWRFQIYIIMGIFCN